MDATNRIDIEVAALRALAADWEDVNWTHFGSRLRPASLSLSDDGAQLGRWSRDTRHIELSRALVLGEPWGVVREVLKHEMAHQFVDEVLRAHDEPPHGPSFRRTCERIGVDARASGLPDPAAGRSPLLDRIAKLLALASSPNVHEAETAMRTARRLMLKHNLERPSDDSGAAGYGYRHLGQPTGRTSEPERLLGGLLGEFFFVQPIWVSVFRVADQKRVSVLEVVGRHENLAMAEYVYSFLRHAAESLWREHKRERGIRSDADRRAFHAGVMRGFADKLRDEGKVQEATGLIWVGDPRTTRYFKRRHPRVQTTSGRSSAGTAAASHGRAAGRELVLNRPLERGPRERGRLLPAPGQRRQG